jgi:hypothetical protein
MELLCAEPPETYAAWKETFDAFGKEHFSQPEQAPGAGLGCICFHGSTRAAVEAIYEHGFDPERCKEGAYGGGPGKPCAYVSILLSDALMYSKPDEEPLREAKRWRVPPACRWCPAPIALPTPLRRRPQPKRWAIRC